MAHHAMKRFGPIGLIAIFVALAMSMLTMAAGTASATTASKSSGGTAVAKKGGYSEAVSGKASDGRTVTGSFAPRKFQVVNKKLVAKGVLSGKISGGGKASRTFHRSVSMPVTDVQAVGSPAGGGGRFAPSAVPAVSCDVLNLVLGPLHLNVLGLVIDLNEVHLDITAVPAGGLLGQLLCGVANLLSGGPLGGLLGQLSDLLNQILGVLNLP
jgi:hypothetical protein